MEENEDEKEDDVREVLGEISGQQQLPFEYDLQSVNEKRPQQQKRGHYFSSELDPLIITDEKRRQVV